MVYTFIQSEKFLISETSGPKEIGNGRFILLSVCFVSWIMMVDVDEE